MTRGGGKSGILQCRICGFKAQRDEFETKVSECQFNGGRLIRHICPSCGVIFGPSKFLEISEAEINDDYAVHYIGFQEGDSTQKEIETFRLLKPDKRKLYLNYGCGRWSKSLQYLRGEGYQVFGYEPHAFEDNNPYMITNKENLKKMRFDGIYSNNVIEHLIYPVKEFEFMKSLLKNKYSKMSHSTPCYAYKYETTRFHTHFYTGNSVNVLCQKTGLDVLERVVKNDNDIDDFICYLYSPQNTKMNYVDQLFGLERSDNGFVLKPKGIMFGPYLTIGGSSQWILEIKIHQEEEVTCKVTLRSGEDLIKIVKLSNGDNIIDIEYHGIVTDLEFVIENTTEREIHILKLEMLVD